MEMINKHMLANFLIFNQTDNMEINMAVNETDFAHYAKKVGKARLLVTCDGSIILIFDTGASLTCTPCKEDFISFTKIDHPGKIVDGIAQGCKIEGEGLVQYTLLDVNDNFIHLVMKAKYVPSIKRRLISPQEIKTKEGDLGNFISNYRQANKVKMAAVEIIPDQDFNSYRDVKVKTTIEIPYHSSINLPSTYAVSKDSDKLIKEQLKQLEAHISVVEHENVNLSIAQKELLKLHFHLNHLSFKHVQWLVRHN